MYTTNTIPLAFNVFGVWCVLCVLPLLFSPLIFTCTGVRLVLLVFSLTRYKLPAPIIMHYLYPSVCVFVLCERMFFFSLIERLNYFLLLWGGLALSHLLHLTFSCAPPRAMFSSVSGGDLELF